MLPGYVSLMPKRSSTAKPLDANEIAFRVLQEAIGEADCAPPVPEPVKPPKEKNPAAVALGRAGGLKGGRSRMDAMTPEDRKALAKKAAAKRWQKKNAEND